MSMSTSAALIGGLAILVAGHAAAADGLVSVKTATPIVLDGLIEAAWSQASELKVELAKTPYKPDNGYPGMAQTTVLVKSLYDAENIYLLIQYADPSQSEERAPWVKQEDGSWKQLKKLDSTGHDNTYYEDKFAILWDINTKGFAKKGCAISCHMAEGGKVNEVEDNSPGRKYTNAAGETLDMWHLKGVRTAPVGQIDDQYIDNSAPNGSKEWGRKSDVKKGGGYSDNVNAAKTGPAFMNAKADGPRYWIPDDQKVPFVDSFKPGDVVPGIIIAPFTGPRGDISCSWNWKDGVWTMEVKRKLVTTGEKATEHDVQFSDLGKTYSFGMAAFDNSQINHVFHEGALKLTFKP